MREQQLKAIQPKSVVRGTTDSKHTLKYAENLLLQIKKPAAPGTVIVGDITYLPLTNGGFAYLATWMDLFTRRILGWAVGETMEEDLIIRAFEMMLPNRRLPKGAIIHSDRGGQYAGRRFRNLLHKHRLRQSMSRAGKHMITLLPKACYPDTKPNYSKAVNLRTLRKRDWKHSIISRFILIGSVVIRVSVIKLR